MKETKPSLYLIGNGHLDPIWLWQLPEGLAEIKATFRSALDRMNEFDGYIFTSACASYYAWVEHNEPELFAEIRQRIAEGRWAIAGGMWVQPDCNLPCGEAFARHLLYSQRYFREKFGRIAKIGYNVDSFGHNGMLPQLLSKAGIEGYIYQRPNSSNEKPELQAHLFLWQAPDGTRLPTYRIPTGYGDSGLKLDVYQELVEKNHHPYLAFYGVGNHGGGPTIRRLTELQELVGDTMQYATVEDFFRDIQEAGLTEDLPVVSEDLQHHASGCYSANARIKQLNRQAESSLLCAEKYDALCHYYLTGLPDQHQKLTAAWKKLLFFQFHDVLAGCSIRDAMEDGQNAMGGVIDQGEEAIQMSLQKLAWSINTHRSDSRAPAQPVGRRLWEKEGEGAPVVVFNPHSFPVCRPVTVSSGRLTAVTAVCDSEGNYLPHQPTRARYLDRDGKESHVFMAELPAYGYRTYYLYRQQAVSVPVEAPPHAEEFVLENKNLRLEFDRDHGWIRTLTDKRTGRVVNSGPLGRAVLVDDQENDTWAHTVFSFRGQAGQFGQPSFRILESGPVRATLRVSTTHGASILHQDYTLYAESEAVEVDCRLFFADRLKFLRLCFPAATESPRVTYGMPYGKIEKAADGKENPAQCWASIHDENNGIAILTDCKYSFSATGDELRVVIARSCCFADHFGVRDGLEEHQDLGDQRFHYMIYPHGPLDHSKLRQLEDVLLQPIRHLQETFHDGPLPPDGSALQGLPENVILEAVKRAENGQGVIARFYETNGKETELTLTLLGRKVKLRFTPYEIKTVFFPAEGRPMKVNLLEDPE